ncbi:HetP family heterocyst commitment protein [Fortiea sp. LEGE XX443]|uniref:HetP family heterocyst commitment protein n=1 Tax=Fortiea sp. LEGE XX443 TaxID=1828611 RepID=UPI0018801304|nr:HetP family heterocyst commitment protein [Fortiea sp. LEGE XX443]MBE9006227.1 HetP family heterocyst commitment protein [Fortiea sp. LEGE XX443]
MTKETLDYNQPKDTTIHPEEFIQIIKAILLGKYCLACILFLHFLRYIPTEYIPYETYMRVLKDNYLPGIASLNKLDSRNSNFTNIKIKQGEISSS